MKAIGKYCVALSPWLPFRCGKRKCSFTIRSTKTVWFSRLLLLTVSPLFNLTHDIAAAPDILSMWVPVEERERLREEINEHLRAIREAGCPVNLEELHAFHPFPASETDNAAPIYERAFEEMRIDGDDRANPHLPLFGEPELPSSGERFTPEQREAVGTFLEKNQETFRLLEEASGIPAARFDVDYTEGFEAFPSHPSRMRQAARTLQLRIQFLAENGDSDAALRSVRTMTAMTRTLFQEPLLIGFLTGTSMTGMTAISIMDIIERYDLTVEELREIEEMLVGLAPEDAFKRMVCGERALGISVFRIVAYDPYRFLGWGELPDRTVSDRLFGVSFLEHHRVSGHWLRDLLFFLETMDSAATISRIPPEGRTKSSEWNRILDFYNEIDANYFLVSAIVGVSFEHIITTDLRANHIRLNAVRLALRLEAARLESGGYPESLDEVVGPDEFHMMTNLVTHEPFEYTVRPDGFVIDPKAERLQPLSITRSLSH